MDGLFRLNSKRAIWSASVSYLCTMTPNRLHHLHHWHPRHSIDGVAVEAAAARTGARMSPQRLCIRDIRSLVQF